jgi:hypothetical protein
MNGGDRGERATERACPPLCLTGPGVFERINVAQIKIFTFPREALRCVRIRVLWESDVLGPPPPDRT